LTRHIPKTGTVRCQPAIFTEMRLVDFFGPFGSIVRVNLQSPGRRATIVDPDILHTFLDDFATTPESLAP
jgi:hypothetical protein